MRRAAKFGVIAGQLMLANPLSTAFAQSDNQVAEVLAHLGATPEQGAEFISNMMPLNLEPFRFADDPAGPATLLTDDFGWIEPNAIGAELVQFPPDFAGPTFPPGTITAAAGSGLVPGGTYGMFITSYSGEMTEENMGGLFVNISIPTILPGGEPWVPITQFPADTWGGAGTIPYFTYGPNPWGLAMFQVQGGSLVDMPFDGLAFLGHGTSGIPVDSNSLLGPDGNWNDLMYAFAIHVHDGSFGSCGTCISAIYADPMIGSDGSINRVFNSTSPVETPLLFGGQTRVTPTTATTSASSTSSTTSTSSSTTTTMLAASDSDDTDTATGVTPASSDGIPIFFIGLVLVGLAVTVGGGYLFVTSRTQTATMTTSESWTNTIADKQPPQDLITTTPIAMVTTPPAIITKGERSGKGEGGSAEAPRKIGLGGTIP